MYDTIRSSEEWQQLGLASQDHLAGKQYLGWQAIREKLKEFEKEDEERRAERAAYGQKGRERERERERPRERERDSNREKERERGRDSRWTLKGIGVIVVCFILPKLEHNQARYTVRRAWL